MTITGPEMMVIVGMILAFYLPMSVWVVRYEKRHQARNKPQD